LNFEYRSVKPIPELTQDHRSLRLEFCQIVVEDPILLSCVWFGNEMGINIQLSKKKAWTQEEICFHEVPKSQRLNVWAAVSSLGKTTLEIYDQNLNHPFYMQILDNHYNEMIRVNWRHWAF